MKNPARLSPVHLDIRVLWMRHSRQISKAEKVAAAIARLQRTWREIAEFKRDENEGQDQQTVEAEFELDLHIGEVKVFDWHWLINTFEAYNLGDLQLAICEQQYPEKSWEIVENESHTVVADRDRFIVCDMMLES